MGDNDKETLEEILNADAEKDLEKKQSAIKAILAEKQIKTREEAMELNQTVMPKTKEERKIKSEMTEDAKKTLEDPKLLLNIVREVQAEGVKGEENTILALINKIMLRLVADAKPTSGNVILSDEPGGGKDVVVDSTCKVLVPNNKYDHRTRLSAKALEYWGTNKGENWTWAERVLYLEDPEEELIKSQAFKVLASGGTKLSTVKDQQLVDLEVKGKPVVIVTSLRASMDEEGGRRWDAMRIDTSKELTKKVIRCALAGFQGEGKKGLNRTLRDALQNHLKPCEVIFPHAKELEKYFSTNLVMRTQVHKLIDYMKASAVLHQHQRKKDKISRLIATWEDYDYARYVFMHLKDEEGAMLNKDEEEFLKILRDANRPLTIKEVSEKYKRHGTSWIYDHVDGFKSKGLLGETYEKEASGALTREVRKIYSINGISSKGFPDKSVFLRFIEKAENVQQEGFPGFPSFIDICKEIDEDRKKTDLKPLFSHLCSKTGENGENVENQSVDGFITDEKNTEKLDQTAEMNMLRELFRQEQELSRTTVIAFVKNYLHKKKPEEYISALQSRGILTSYHREKLSFTG